MQATRYEVKMTCAEQCLPHVRAWLRLHPDLFLEAYRPRQVNNLYFDTREADCLNDHLCGVAERNKLRFRWYGTDYAAVRGTLELKRKANQLGWKIQCPVPVAFDLGAITWHELIGQLREHVDGRLAVCLSYTDQPALLNSFTREYYESVDRQVRVTVDYDQCAWDQITYPAPNLWFKTPGQDRAIIEVKSDSRLHRRVSNVVSSFPFRVERNSKYVSGMLSSLSSLSSGVR